MGDKSQERSISQQETIFDNPLRMKHGHQANTTLRHMVRISGDHDARQTSHESDVAT